MDSTTEKSLRKDLMLHARALDIPEGAAEDFINSAIESAKTSLAKKSVITHADFNRIVARALKKYHRDLAYIYEIHSTII